MLEDLFSLPLIEEQSVADFLGEMAGFAFPAHDLSLILRLPVMAPETICERPCPQIRAFRMVGVPRFTVSRNMSARDDNRIAFDRLAMHDPGMARRTAFPMATLHERIDMCTMAHDKADLTDRLWQIARGDL